MLLAGVSHACLCHRPYALDPVFGFNARYFIALIRLAPILVFSYQAVAENVKDFGNAYSMTLMVADVIWAWAWIPAANVTR